MLYWVQGPFGSDLIIIIIAAYLPLIILFQKPLPLSTPTTIELQDGEEVTLTLINANHCPGAVMSENDMPLRMLISLRLGISLKVAKAQSCIQAISARNNGS